jgi:hypothetical protein
MIWTVIGMLLVVATFMASFTLFSNSYFYDALPQSMTRGADVDDRVLTLSGRMTVTVAASIFFLFVYIMIVNII